MGNPLLLLRGGSISVKINNASEEGAELEIKDSINPLPQNIDPNYYLKFFCNGLEFIFKTGE